LDHSWAFRAVTTQKSSRRRRKKIAITPIFL
jgi:hypothetical protein